MAKKSTRAAWQRDQFAQQRALVWSTQVGRAIVSLAQGAPSEVVTVAAVAAGLGFRVIGTAVKSLKDAEGGDLPLARDVGDEIRTAGTAMYAFAGIEAGGSLITDVAKAIRGQPTKPNIVYDVVDQGSLAYPQVPYGGDELVAPSPIVEELAPAAVPAGAAAAAGLAEPQQLVISQPQQRPMSESEETAYLSQRGLFRDFDGTIRYYPHLLQQQPDLVAPQIVPPVVVPAQQPPQDAPMQGGPYQQPPPNVNVFVGDSLGPEDFVAPVVGGAVAGGAAAGLQRVLRPRAPPIKPVTLAPAAPRGPTVVRAAPLRVLGKVKVPGYPGANALGGYLVPANIAYELSRKYGVRFEEARGYE